MREPPRPPERSHQYCEFPFNTATAHAMTGAQRVADWYRGYDHWWWAPPSTVGHRRCLGERLWLRPRGADLTVPDRRHPGEAPGPGLDKWCVPCSVEVNSWSQATVVVCCSSNSTGVSHLSGPCQRCRLCQISRYSKIALANSIRVFHRRRSSVLRLRSAAEVVQVRPGSDQPSWSR